MTEKTSQNDLCRVALTLGDPAGIGPEICMRILQQRPLASNIALTVIGSAAVLRWIQDQLDTSIELKTCKKPANIPGTYCVMDRDNVSTKVCRRPAPTREGGSASLDYITTGVKQIQAGRADVLVTSPINKKAIDAAGSPFPGHTEMLGAMTDVPDPVMMLMNSQLKVTFATKHVALKNVPDQLSRETIQHTATTMADSLTSDFAIGQPRVGICALNPHSGDQGRFGNEEAELIQPAITEARASGYTIDGPYPSDTLFARALNDEFDGIVAMYHDQGMIPIKLMGFKAVVNVTLGLPFVRTSPGHGTAYDIAGTGTADPASTLQAIRTGVRMYRAGLAVT